jgi:hypothetical protein
VRGARSHFGSSLSALAGAPAHCCSGWLVRGRADRAIGAIPPAPRAAIKASPRPNPAWHRRRQQARKTDRELVALARRVGQAASRLECHHGSSAGNLQPFEDFIARQMGDGSWRQAIGRKKGWTKVQCGKAGCSGSCPLNVVLRSNQKDGIPAKCFECGSKYKVPAGTAPPQNQKSSHNTGRGNGSDARLQDQLRALREEVKSLKAAAKQETKASDDTGEVAMVGDEAAREKVRCLREKLKSFHNMDVALRPYLDAQRGYDKLAADLERELQATCAAQREAKPLSTQKASAEAHLQKVAKLQESTTAQLAKLQEQHDRIAAQLSAKQAEATMVALQVEAAKQEVASIAEKIAADLRGSPQRPGPVATTLSAAAIEQQEVSLVRDIFKLVPEPELEKACAAHGISSGEVVSKTQAILAKCDAQAAMAVSVASAAQAGADESQQDAIDMEQELDDEQAERLAEVFTEDIKDEQKECRAARVASAKAHLKSQGKVVLSIVAKKAKLKR